MDATISFGLPFELGDCPYGKSRINPVVPSSSKPSQVNRAGNYTRIGLW